MENRREISKNQRAFDLTVILAAAATFVSAYSLLRIPADSKNAFFLGLSKERLVMVSGFAVLFIINILSIIYRDRVFEKFKDNKWIWRTGIFSTVISSFFLLIPDYRFKRAAAYFIRIRPYILWLFLTSSLFSMYYQYAEDKFAAVRETWTNFKKERKIILSVLLVLLAGTAFVEITGLGKTAEKSLWNKNGIPLQSIQLFTAVVIFTVFWKGRIFEKAGNKKRLLNFLLIWALSALIWSAAPMADHFFAPGPYPPDQQFFPYSDAFNYDFSAQTALHGWGFNMKRTLLKPTLAFTALLSHLATGNDINRSMMVQSAAFAVLPAIIYLFGSSVGGTGCGYLAAFFSMIKEWNALHTGQVMTITSRLFMSEFLTQILLAAYCYALFLWLKKSKHETLYAITAGGMISLGFFTRYNFAAFLPAALPLLIISYRKHFGRLFKTLFFFILSVLLTAAPLIYREKDMRWGLIPELKFTVETVLLKNRLSEPEQENLPEELIPESISEETVSKPQPESIPEETMQNPKPDAVSEETMANPKPETIVPTAAAAELPAAEPVITMEAADVTAVQENENQISETDNNNGTAQSAEITESKPDEPPAETAQSGQSQEAPVLQENQDPSENKSDEINTSQITQEYSHNNSNVTLPVYQSVINHGLHNFITSALTLPMEIVFHDLDHLYAQEKDGLWRDDWQGQFSTRQWILIAFWMVLGAVSIGFLIKNHGTAGFSLPYFWLVYAFSVGISRSSGGRYVVPANWIPMLLLAYCITLFASKGQIHLADARDDAMPVWKPIAAEAALFAFFSVMCLLENKIPVTDNSVPGGDLAVLKERLAGYTGINWEEAEKQINEGKMHLTHGNALYPRFYYFRDGENINDDVLMWKEYSRLTFIGINYGSKGRKDFVSQGYLMPSGNLIDKFPHDSVFRALSCKSEFSYEDVLAVTVETKDGNVYTYVRDPLPAFSCPVPEPVCDSLENCR